MIQHFHTVKHMLMTCGISLIYARNPLLQKTVKSFTIGSRRMQMTDVRYINDHPDTVVLSLASASHQRAVSVRDLRPL